MYTDNTFFPASQAMLTCLTMAVGFISVPPAKIQIRPGSAVALDLSQNANECCDGLAWVREGDVFPSTTFPIADTGRLRCATTWAFEMEIGIVRCAPVGDIQNMPTEDEWLETALLLSEDLAAIRRTICCFDDAWPYDVATGRISKLGPEGGCVGNFASFTVQAFPHDTWPT